MGKMLVFTFKDNEEMVVEKILSVLADKIQFETISPLSSPVLSFPGLEIRLHQRQVLRDGADVNLPRLEYGTLAYSASSPTGYLYKNRFSKLYGT